MLTLRALVTTGLGAVRAGEAILFRSCTGREGAELGFGAGWTFLLKYDDDVDELSL